MPRDIDEDLIEATIRKVAEAQAARANGEQPAGSDAPVPVDEAPAEKTPPERPRVDEDLIEATIRRVAAQKAAKAAGDPDWEHAEAPPLEPEPQEEDAPPSELPAAEADAIDAPNPPSVRAFAGAQWEHHAITAHVDGAPPAERDAEPDVARKADAPSPRSRAAARAQRPPQHDDPLERIEATLAALVERVDAIIPIIERLAAAGANEWSDTPMPSIGPSALVRSVMRDPSPRAATAEHLEPEMIDTRPIPKPLPPLEPRRNIDLLPRTYRITVEDKRRGVDLVPLHRALLGIEGVRDMSLLSYNNGIAIVSLEATRDIEPETVREAVSHAMSREARIEANMEQQAMVVKLAED